MCTGKTGRTSKAKGNDYFSVFPSHHVLKVSRMYMHVFCSLFYLSLKFETTCRLHPFHHNIIMNISVVEILKLSDLCNLSTWSHNKENQKESHPNEQHDQCHLIDMQEESLLFLFHLVHCQSVVLHHS